MTFNEWVKQTRTARGLTLRDVAIASSIAIGHLHEIENGKTNPTLRMANRLCAGLGFKLWQVLKAIDDE